MHKNNIYLSILLSSVIANSSFSCVFASDTKMSIDDDSSAKPEKRKRPSADLSLDVHNQPQKRQKLECAERQDSQKPLAVQSMNSLETYTWTLTNDALIHLSTFMTYRDIGAFRVVSRNFKETLMSSKFYELHRPFFAPSNPENMYFGPIDCLEANESFFRYLTRPSIRTYNFGGATYRQYPTFMDNAGNVLCANGMLVTANFVYPGLPLINDTTFEYRDEVLSFSKNGSTFVQRVFNDENSLCFMFVNKRGRRFQIPTEGWSYHQLKLLDVKLNDDGSIVTLNNAWPAPLAGDRDFPDGYIFRALKITDEGLSTIEFASRCKIPLNSELTFGVGSYRSKPVKWSNDCLSILPTGHASSGSAEIVSKDGEIVAGELYIETNNGAHDYKHPIPCFWKEDKMHLLPLPDDNDDISWNVSHISDDGTSIVGYSWEDIDDDIDGTYGLSRTVLWNNGNVQVLDNPEGYISSFPYYTSPDGSVIWGLAYTRSDDAAPVIWKNGALISLNSYFNHINVSRLKPLQLSSNQLIMSGGFDDASEDQDKIFVAVMPRQGPRM